MLTDFNLLSQASWSQHSVCAVLITCAVCNISTQQKKHSVLVSRVGGMEHSKGLRNEYQELHRRKQLYNTTSQSWD